MQKIFEKIGKEGPISFHTFMDMALYYPHLGYYSSPQATIGKEGDFYTSSHLHPVFGAMIGKQLLEMWEFMGSPGTFHAVEMGAGLGYLSKDIHDYLHRPSKDTAFQQKKSNFLNSLRYVIVEPYSHFVEKQTNILEKSSPPHHTTWIKSLHELHNINGCIFSNELLDAFPVHLVEMEDELKEIYIHLEGDELAEIKIKAKSDEIQNHFRNFSVTPEPGYRTEINLGIHDWLKEASTALSTGFILTIDYGYSAKEYYDDERTSGTLLCYHKHLYNENPYQNIGEQDITAHVNFSAVKMWGDEHDFTTIGYCSQGTYLIASGIDELITELYADSPDYLLEISKIKGLIIPQGMGESHRVMVQYKGDGSPELRGFSMRNQVGSL